MKILLNGLLLTSLACQGASAVQDSDHASKPSAPGASASSVHSHSDNSDARLSVNDFHGALTVLLHRDGSVEATLDGQPVPPEHLQREGDRLRVLDADGNKAYDVQVMGDPVLLGYPYSANGKSRRANNIGQWKELMAGANNKRHVIGVVTTPVDAGLAAQLGLEPDSAVIVNEVSSGLPAEKAGVQPWDVITRIDGTGPITRDLLHDRITAAEVGKTLKLTLLRRGQPLDLDVAVGETTDENGSLARLSMTDDPNGDSTVWNLASTYGDAVRDDAALEKAHAELERARVSLEKRIEELQAQAAKGGTEGAAAGKASDDLKAALESMQVAQESMQQHADGASPEVRFFNVGPEGSKGLLLRKSGSGGARGFTVREDADAGGANPDAAASDKRLTELEARIAQLDARVAELVKALQDSGKKP
jgi:PDZ domain